MYTYNRCPLAFVGPIHIIMRLYCVVAVRLHVHQFIAAQNKLSTYRFFSFFNNISYICKHNARKKSESLLLFRHYPKSNMCVFLKLFRPAVHTTDTSVQLYRHYIHSK